MAKWGEYYSLILAMLDGDEVAGLAAEDFLNEYSALDGKRTVDGWRYHLGQVGLASAKNRCLHWAENFKDWVVK